MKHEWRKNKIFRICMSVVGVLVVVVLAQLLFVRVRTLEQAKKEYTLQVKERKTAIKNAKLQLSDEKIEHPKCDALFTSDSVLGGAVQGQILLSMDAFSANSITKSWSNISSVTCDFDGVKEGDVLILEFAASTMNETPIGMQIQCGNEEVSVEVGNALKRYYIPFVGISENNSISFQYSVENDINMPVILREVCLVDYGEKCSIDYLRTGEYLIDEFNSVTIPAEKSLGQGKAAVYSEGRLFVIYKGELIVYKEETGTLSEITRLSGFGETRDICLSVKGKVLLITSRESGAYFVDISNPDAPVTASHYDTLELCVGADIYANYAFISSRYFGVEVVDISDIYAPKYITKIQAEEDSEYQDCYVNEGYLYVGVYANKRVDIYDVRDLSKIQRVSTIKLDGAGQGLVVRNGILYAATGRNDNSHTAESSADYGYGLGNGFEVYDVTNIEKPVLIGKEKIDGRNSLYPVDVWDVAVNGDYAFVSLMNGGLYIYDISEMSNIKRVQKVEIVSQEVGDSVIEDSIHAEVAPYRMDQETHACVCHTIPVAGGAYIICPDMGIYWIEGDWTISDNDIKEDVIITNGKPEVMDVEVPTGFATEIYETETSVYAIAELDAENLIVACGEGGIQILDKNLNVMYVYHTEYSVKDIRVCENLVYAAESEGGLTVYRYENGILTKLASYMDATYNSTYSSLEITKDGKLALVQAGYSKYRLIDCSDPYNLKLLDIPTDNSVGAMYYRNVCIGSIEGKYVGISGRKGINWFYYDEGNVRYLKDASERTGSERIGLASIGNQYLLISTNGYRVINPIDGATSSNYEIDKNYFNGKCVVKNNLLVVTKEYSGNICVVDISDITNPLVIARINTDYITDIPCIVENTIYVPCRYNGILKITAQ